MFNNKSYTCFCGLNKVNLISQKFDGYWCESYTPICKGRSTWNSDYCPFKVVRFWFSNGGPHWYLSISHVYVCKTMYPNGHSTVVHIYIYILRYPTVLPTNKHTLNVGKLWNYCRLRFLFYYEASLKMFGAYFHDGFQLFSYLLYRCRKEYLRELSLLQSQA